MRHFRSILYAVVLAPAVWVLVAVGLTHDLTARGRDGFAVESLTGLAMLLLGGAAYGILIFAPISPLGPTAAGVVFLTAGAWALSSPSAYADVWPHAVVKEGFDLSRPGYGLAALLSVPMILTVLSVRRWRGYEPLVLPLVGSIGRARGTAPAPGVPASVMETAALPTGSQHTTLLRLLDGPDERTTLLHRPPPAFSDGQSTTVMRLPANGEATTVLRSPRGPADEPPTVVVVDGDARSEPPTVALPDGDVRAFEEATDDLQSVANEEPTEDAHPLADAEPTDDAHPLADAEPTDDVRSFADGVPAEDGRSAGEEPPTEDVSEEPPTVDVAGDARERRMAALPDERPTEDVRSEDPREEPTTVVIAEGPRTRVSEEPTILVVAKEAPKADAVDEPTTAFTAEQPPTAGTAEEPTTAFTAEQPPTAGTTEEPTTAFIVEQPPTAGTTEEPAAAAEPTTAFTVEQPPTACAAEEPAAAEEEPTTAFVAEAMAAAGAVEGPGTDVDDDESATAAAAEGEPTTVVVAGERPVEQARDETLTEAIAVVGGPAAADEIGAASDDVDEPGSRQHAEIPDDEEPVEAVEAAGGLREVGAPESADGPGDPTNETAEPIAEAETPSEETAAPGRRAEEPVRATAETDADVEESSEEAAESVGRGERTASDTAEPVAEAETAARHAVGAAEEPADERVESVDREEESSAEAAAIDEADDGAVAGVPEPVALVSAAAPGGQFVDLEGPTADLVAIMEGVPTGGTHVVGVMAAAAAGVPAEEPDEGIVVEEADERVVVEEADEGIVVEEADERVVVEEADERVVVEETTYLIVADDDGGFTQQFDARPAFELPGERTVELQHGSGETTQTLGGPGEQTRVILPRNIDDTQVIRLNDDGERTQLLRRAADERTAGDRPAGGRTPSIAGAESPNFADDPTGRIQIPQPQADEPARTMTVMNMERPPEIPAPRKSDE